MPPQQRRLELGESAELLKAGIAQSAQGVDDNKRDRRQKEFRQHLEDGGTGSVACSSTDRKQGSRVLDTVDDASREPTVPSVCVFLIRYWDWDSRAAGCCIGQLNVPGATLGLTDRVGESGKRGLTGPAGPMLGDAHFITGSSAVTGRHAHPASCQGRCYLLVNAFF